MLDFLPPELALRLDPLLLFASRLAAEAEALLRAEATRPALIALLLGAALLGWIAAGLLRARPARRRARRAATEAAEARALAEDKALRLAAAEAEAARLDPLERALDEARAYAVAARERAAGLEAALEAARGEAETRLADLRRMGEEVERKFSALAQAALDGSARRFLGLVSERFEAHRMAAGEDLAKRQTAIDALVKPLQENLTRLERQTGELERRRSGAYQEMLALVAKLEGQNLKLGAETAKLVQSLRSPKTRGRWGEFQLRQVFEMAGMVEHVDFVTEHSVRGEEGGLRPDAVVRLPGGKTVVIDAKTPLAGYLDAHEAETPEAREAALKRHSHHLREHVRRLSAKSYWQALPNTPDFVVMFIPGEPIFAAAVERDPELFETAAKARVLVCTPATLIALVKAIAYGWQQETMAKNAQAMAETATELYDRVRKFVDHLGAVGKGLGVAVEKYNAAIGSLEGRVLPTARRLEGLGVAKGRPVVEAPARVETDLRPVTAAELAPEPAALPAAE